MIYFHSSAEALAGRSTTMVATCQVLACTALDAVKFESWNLMISIVWLFACIIYTIYVCIYILLYCTYALYVAYYKLDRIMFFGCKYLRSGPQEFGFPWAYNHWPETNLKWENPPVSLWMSFCSWNLSHPSGRRKRIEHLRSMVHDPSPIYHRGVYHVKMYRCCECSGGIVGFSWLSAWLLVMSCKKFEAAAQPHSSLQQKAAEWRCHSWWPGRHPQESIGENDFPC